MGHYLEADEPWHQTEDSIDEINCEVGEGHGLRGRRRFHAAGCMTEFALRLLSSMAGRSTLHYPYSE